MYYLNNASHVPMNQDVIDGLAKELGTMYNPSDDGEYAEKSKNMIEDTKYDILCSVLDGNFIHRDEYEVIFTSSGSAANTLAIAQIMDCFSTPIEHSSVNDNHFVSKYVDIDNEGYVDIEALKEYDLSGGGGVSIHYVNNELGIVQDVKKIAEIVHGAGGLVHIDAVQAYGNIPIDVYNAGADFMSLSGHKIGALAGIGCLIVRKELLSKMKNPVIFGEQQYGLFGGTENLAGIYSWNLALKSLEYSNWNIKGRFLSIFDSTMRREGIKYVINPFNKEYDLSIKTAYENDRYDNKIISIAFDGVNGEALKLALEIYGIIVSTGSACNTGKESYILSNVENTKKWKDNTIRISLSCRCVKSNHLFEEQINIICNCIAKCVKRVKRIG